MQSPWHPFFFLYPSLPGHAPMFSCAGRIAFLHILSWSRLPGEGGLPIHPSFLVPAGFLSRTYSHGRTCPARAIGAAPLFGNTSFFPYTRQHSRSQPNQSRSPGEVIVPGPSIFPCAGRIAFPLILPWSCPPGEGCVHYTRSLPRIVRLWQPSMNAQASEGLALPFMPCVHYTITRLDSKVPLGSRNRIFTEFIHIFLTFFQNPPVSAHSKLCYNKITLQS